VAVKKGSLYYPSFADFKKLKGEGNAIPVYRRLFADNLTPVSAFRKIGDKEPAFLFESAAGAEQVARYSFLGCNPFLIFTARRNEVTIKRDQAEEKISAPDPLTPLEKLTNELKPASVPGLPRFSSGAVGYLSYDCVRYFEHLPQPPQNDLDLPDLMFSFYDSMLIFDHLDKTLKVVALARLEGKSEKTAYRQACDRADALVEMLSAPLTEPAQSITTDISFTGKPTVDFKSNFERSEFEDAVRKCKEYIRAGDTIQIVISQRLASPTTAAPFDIYRTLRVVNPAPYMFYMSLGDLKLIGSSPEKMVGVERGEITVRPIAGTRHRGETPEEDAALADELIADPKDCAEHAMLLDLGRNDVGRVSEFGSVKITEKMIIERYPYVMHITSNVVGRLRKEKSVFDVLRACHPAGTVSGAPKVRAMEIIDELEPNRRGPYAGAVGYIDFSGNIDTCIAIRTIVLKGNMAYVQAGAGIVADSVPEREYEETMNKAKGLLLALSSAPTTKLSH
jgi:anthranilate synthase component 1